MGASTYNGPVRSENGFQTISKNSTTGAITVTSQMGTGDALMTAGTGITTGTGTVYLAEVTRAGTLVTTRIFVDLTGLSGTGTAGDIIGVNAAANCHLGQIVAAVNGTIIGGRMTCLEAPAGGNADIDLYAATESTGTEDAAVSGLTETLLVNSGALSLGTTVVLAAFPAADQYLYLVAGTATDATFTAGKLLIELFGYDA